MPKTTNKPIQTISGLEKRIGKLEKEIKKHQDFVDRVSTNLMVLNPVLFYVLLKYKSKGAKTKSSSTKKTPRLKGKRL